MNPIKTMLVTAGMAGAMLASAQAAQAHTSVSLSIGVPVVVAQPAYVPPPVTIYEPAPVYYAPAPVYVEPWAVTYYNGRDRHHHYDWKYWQQHPGHDNGGHGDRH